MQERKKRDENKTPVTKLRNAYWASFPLWMKWRRRREWRTKKRSEREHYLMVVEENNEYDAQELKLVNEEINTAYHSYIKWSEGNKRVKN